MALKYPLVSNSSTLTIEELPAGDELALDNLTVSGNASISGNANVGNLGTGGSITATGNVTGGNINFGAGRVSGTGNVYAANFIGNISGNIDAAGSNTQVQFNDTNDILGASAGFTFDKTSNAVVITGNVTGGNLITAGLTSSATISASGNANVGNLGTAGLVTATGNITGGNLITAGLATVTGNITGGNLTTAGTANIGTLAVSGTSSHTGNASFGNISGTGSASFTGNVGGGNVLTSSIVGTGITITSTGALNLAPTGNITANSKNINNLADPADAQDAATKSYVDSVAQGLDTKASVVAATTANITLSGTQTIDGVVLIAGDRVLVKNQTLSQNNGIYLCAAGAWTRTTDMDSWAEVPGAYVFVEGGTTLADTGWVCTSDAGGTLGTTAIVWTQFSGAGSYTAGTGLTLTGTVFSVDAAQSQITSVGTLTSLSVTGNITGGNLTTTGTLSAGNTTVTGGFSVSGNATFGNLTSSTITSIGNLTAPNISVDHIIGSGMNVASTGNLLLSGTGNVLIFSSGEINLNAVGNITANSKNITGVADPVQAQDAATKNYVDGAYTAGNGISVTSRVISVKTDGVTTSINAGNVVVPAGAVFTTPNIGAATGTSLQTSGNVTANVFKTANISIDIDSIDATANLEITASNGKTIAIYNGNGSSIDVLTTGITLETLGGVTTYSWTFGNTGNTTLPTGGALTSTGNISTTGNVTGNYILGDGSQLTSLPGVSNLSNGNSNVVIASAGANVQIAVNGVANTVVIGQGTLSVLGPMATAKTITANSVVAADMNAILISPVTIGDGVSVTVPATSTLYIFTPA